MQTSRVRRAGALLVGLALVAAACGDDDEASTATTAAEASETETAEAPATTAEAAPETTAAAATTMAPETTAPAESSAAAGGGELAGLQGTTPMAADAADWGVGLNEFWVEQGNEPLIDVNYGPEAYDAIMIIALAVADAGTDGSDHANYIVDVTKGGEKCSTFADCMAIIEADGDVDYDGISGPGDFNGNGEPVSGLYGLLEFGDDNRLLPDPIDFYPAALPESAYVDNVPVEVEREGDGILKFGGLLPETGNLAFLGPPMIAGVAYAVAEINAAGGVLGADVEYSPGDSGGPAGDGVAPATVTALLAENVDAIIGAASSGVSLTVLDTVITAGVTMFSPANTAAGVFDNDKGLYFRNAPTDIMQAAVLGSIVADAGFASAYVLNLDDAYGNGFTEFLVPSLEASGVEVLGAVAYDPNAATFDAEVAGIVAADPDAVILIGFAESSKIIRTAIEQGVGPTVKQWYGSDGNIGNGLGEDFDAGK